MGFESIQDPKDELIALLKQEITRLRNERDAAVRNERKLWCQVVKLKGAAEQGWALLKAVEEDIGEDRETTHGLGHGIENINDTLIKVNEALEAPPLIEAEEEEDKK